jgi:hypothetical protein
MRLLLCSTSGESSGFCNICDRDITTDEAYYMCTHLSCVDADTDRSFDAHTMCATHLTSAAKELVYTGVHGRTAIESAHQRLHHTDGAHRGGLKKVLKGAKRPANDWTGSSASEAAVGSKVTPPVQLPLASPSEPSQEALMRSLTAPSIDPSLALNRSLVAVDPAPITEPSLSTIEPVSVARSNRVAEFIGTDQEPVIAMDPTQVRMMEAVDHVAYDMLNESTNRPSSPASVTSHVSQRVVELSRSLRKAGVSMNSPSLFTDAHHQSYSTLQEEPLQLARAMSQMVVSSVSKRLQFDAIPLTEVPAAAAVSPKQPMVRSPSIISTASVVSSSAASSCTDASMVSAVSQLDRSVSSSVMGPITEPLARDWKIVTYVPSAFVVLELSGLPDGLPPMTVITQWASMFPAYERDTSSREKSIRELWSNVRSPSAYVTVNGAQVRKRMPLPQWSAIYDTNPAAIQYIKDHLTFNVIQQMAIMHNSAIGCQPGHQMVDVIDSKIKTPHLQTIEWTVALHENMLQRYQEYIVRRAQSGNSLGPTAASAVTKVASTAAVVRKIKSPSTVAVPAKAKQVMAVQAIEVASQAERKKKKQKITQ